MPQRVKNPTAISEVGQDARPTEYFVGQASCLDSMLLGYFRMTILRVPEKSPASK